MLTLVSIIRNSGVVSRVGTREAHEVAGGGAAASANLELVASGVELGARVRVGGVQSNGLVTDEVVARLDAGRDGVLNTSVAKGLDGILCLVSIHRRQI